MPHALPHSPTVNPLETYSTESQPGHWHWYSQHAPFQNYKDRSLSFSIFVLELRVGWGPATPTSLFSPHWDFVKKAHKMSLPLSPWRSDSVLSSCPFNLPTEIVPPHTPISSPWCFKHGVLWSFVEKAPTLTFRGVLFTCVHMRICLLMSCPFNWTLSASFLQKFL